MTVHVTVQVLATPEVTLLLMQKKERKKEICLDPKIKSPTSAKNLKTK